MGKLKKKTKCTRLGLDGAMARPERRGRVTLSRATSSTPLSPTRNSICRNDKSKPKQGRVRPKQTKRKCTHQGKREEERRPRNMPGKQQIGTSYNTKQTKHQNTYKKKRETSHTPETETENPRTKMPLKKQHQNDEEPRKELRKKK